MAAFGLCKSSGGGGFADGSMVWGGSVGRMPSDPGALETAEEEAAEEETGGAQEAALEVVASKA